MGTTGSARTLQMAGRLALSVGVVAFATAALLIVFFVAGDPFGKINDVGNAVVGCLSAGLAWLLHVSARSGPLGVAGVLAACAGAVTMVVGSALIITDSTGYVLAGLVSSLGAAFIGLWLIGFSRQTGGVRRPPPRPGLVAGAVMLLGLLSVPGIVARVDTDVSPPWHVTAAGISWLGTYLLYPIWAILLSRGLRRSVHSA